MDFRTLPRFLPPKERSSIRLIRSPQPQQEREQPTILGGGLRAGFNELQGLGGAAVAAVGKAVGAQGLEDWGVATATKNFAEAQQYGRPDLETAPWREGGADVLPWLGYQVAKQGPQIAGALLATVATGGVGALTGATAATAGRAAATQALRSGLGREAAKAAARKAAVKQTIRGSAGGVGFSSGIGAGSMYNEAIEREAAGGGEATRGDALKALALAPLYGAAEYAPQALLAKTALKSAGTVGGAARRIVAGAAAGAGTEGVTEGFQTYLENTFRPDLSDAEKARRIVDGALTGAAVGGTLRGAASVRVARESKPQNVENTDIENFVDDSIAPVPTQDEAAVAVEQTDDQVVEQALARAPQPEVAPMVGPQVTEQQEILTQPEMPAQPRPFADYSPIDLEATAKQLLEVQSRPVESPEGAVQRQQAQDLFKLVSDEIVLRQQEQAQADQTAAQPVDQVQQQVDARVEANLRVPPVAENATQDQIDQRAAEVAQLEREILAAQEQAQLDQRGAVAQQDPNADLLPGLAGLPMTKTEVEAAVDVEKADRNQQIRDINLARHYIDSQEQGTDFNTEKRNVSNRAKELGLVGEFVQEFEQRIADADQRVNDAPAGVTAATEAVRTADIELERVQASGAKKQVVTKARKNLEAAVRDLEAARAEVRAAADARAELEPLIAKRNQIIELATRAQQGDTDALQKPSTAEVDVRQAALSGGQVAERDPQGEGATTARLIEEETPVQTEVRRQRMSEAGVYFTTPFRIERPASANNNTAATTIDLTGMLNEGQLADQLRNDGVATSRQQARSLAKKIYKEARRGGTDFEAVMQRDGLNVQPVPQDVTLERPAYNIPEVRMTEATAQVPGQPMRPAQNRTGTGGLTTPDKAVMSPQNIPATPSVKPDGTRKKVEDVKADAPADSVVQAITSPPNTPVSVPNSPQSSNGLVGKVVDGFVKSAALVFRTDPKTMKASFRKESLQWADKLTIAGLYDQYFSRSRVKDFIAVDTKRKNMTAFVAQLGANAYNVAAKMNNANQDRLSRLMELTSHTINPALPWEQHTWLQNDPDVDFLRERHAEAVKKYRDMAQSRRVFDRMANLNRAVLLDEQVATLKDLLAADARTQNDTEFLAGLDNVGFVGIERAKMRDEAKMVARLQQDRTDLLAKIDQLVAKRYGQADAVGRDTAEGVRLTILADPIAEVAAKIKDQMQFDDVIPYFHKGRFGDYRVSFKLAGLRDESGKFVPNVAAEKAVAKAFADMGFVNIGIQDRGQTNSVMMKFDSLTDRDNAFELAQRLRQQGFVEGEPTVGSEETQTYAGDAAVNIRQQLLDFFNTELAQIEQGGAQIAEIRRKQAQFMRGLVEKFVLESSAPNSNRRVMAHRQNVHGYSKDFLRSFTHRWQIGTASVARSATSADYERVKQGMRDDIAASSLSDPVTNAIQQDVLNELIERQKVENVNPSTAVGFVRAVNHVWYLGMSPAYMLMTALHVPIVSLPKLGAEFGFTRSSGELLAAAKDAVGLLRVIIANSPRKGDSAFTTLSPDALRAAYPGRDDFINMVLDLARTGVIDMGAQMRELGTIAAGRADTGVDTALRLAGSAGFYSEVFSRLVTGIAAYRMNQKKGLSGEQLVNKVANTVHETMLDYSASNIGRRTGERGFAGPLTPIMTSFQQYNFQMLGLIYRETYKSFERNEADPVRRAQARKFLAGHLSAVTILAGTMGLPFMASISRAVEGLANLLFRDDDDEPFNLDAAYRNYLAEVFGRDAGEVIARGVPRALGFDLSNRLGEQYLLPGSRLLSDRRFLLDFASTQDAVADAAMRRLGAPLGIPASIAGAASELANGNHLKAMVAGTPIAIQNAFKAYKLSEDGYVDTNGNSVPLTATGYDVMLQALGLAPQQKAEYNEVRGVEQIYRLRASKRKQLITTQVTNALRAGDGQAAREWLAEAVEWDRNNPGTPILPTLTRTITGRFTKDAIARATGLPRGANYKDPAVWSQTAFRNY